MDAATRLVIVCITSSLVATATAMAGPLPVGLLNKIAGSTTSLLPTASGSTRVGAGNVTTRPLPRGAFKRTYDEAERAFLDRLAAARAFLKKKGLEGVIVAKMVTADLWRSHGSSQAEHVEWQFFLVPLAKGKQPKKTGPWHAATSGLLNENRLMAWLKKQGLGSSDAPFLRSEDNPLFLGRAAFGHQGSGLYTAVPDYAEVGGNRHGAREVEAIAVATPAGALKAIGALYDSHRRGYAKDGTCHQAAAVVGRTLGYEPHQIARKIQGMWGTRLLYGREGR